MMKVEGVTDTLEMALAASTLDDANIVHTPMKYQL